MAGALRWSTTPSSAEVKESVGLYLYYPSRLSWPVLGWNLPLSSYLSEINGLGVTFPGVKQPVYGINQQHTSCRRVIKHRSVSLFPLPPLTTPGISWPVLWWNLPYRKRTAYVFQILFSLYHIGKWSVIYTFAVVKYIEYVLCDNCRVFNLNQVVSIVSMVPETLMWLFQFCAGHQ